MKENLSYINKYPKEDVYAVYLTTEFAFKEYDDITRRKMLEAIYDQIVYEPSWLETYLNEETLSFFIDVANDKYDLIKLPFKKYAILQNLQEAYLIYFDTNYRKYIIPSKIKEVIQNYVISENHHLMDEFYYFIKGLILTRGLILVEEAHDIYLTLKPSHMDLDFKKTLVSLSRFMIEIQDYYLFNSNLIVVNDFETEINLSYEPKFQYTWEMYISFGKYGVNREIDIFDELYLKAIKDLPEKIAKETFERIITFIQDNGSFMKDLMKHNYNLLIKNKELALKLYEKTIDEFPSWEFKGDHFSMVDIEYERERDFEFQNDFMCPCGSGNTLLECCANKEVLLGNHAILEYNMERELYAMLHMLMYEANLKHKMFKYKSIVSLIDNLDKEDFIKLKDLVFEDKAVIKDFIEKHKDDLMEFQMEILNGFLNSYKNTFIAIRYVDQKLLLYDETTNTQYIVSGIMSPISENLYDSKLPVFVETRLIPLKDRITYDVFINEMPVEFGEGIKEMLNESLKQAKIVTSIKDFKK